MASTIHVSGLGKFDSAIAEQVLKVDAASRIIVEKGGLMIASEAKKGFRPRPSGSQRVSKKTGRIYYSFAPPFQATPPIPTNRTGNTSASIKIQRISPVPGGWMSMTGPSTPYSPFVEYGTSHQQKEPFMETATDKSRIEIQALADEEYAKALA
jgi:HK97 gp10 family phage protein